MAKMIVVISDLHFEEEKSDIILDAQGAVIVDFRRNVPAAGFEDMMRDVADQARAKGITHIELVLAGDIFDLYRTQYWFRDDSGLRPYVGNRDVTPALEARLLAIIDGIAAETEVARSLAAFRRFAAGRYLDAAGGEAAFGIPTILHYIPGNHDRLANATPAIRQRVRQLLGLAGDEEPFFHSILSADPPVLIRHGHEYDRFNFAIDLRRKKIPAALPDHLYESPCWGDFNTVMVAARLPFLFRRHFTDAKIAGDDLLQVIYSRLLEFDDVRPQTAVLDFFLSTTVPKALADRFDHREKLQAQMWAVILPVFRQLLDEMSRDRYFRSWIRRFWPYLAPILWLRPWRLPLPLWLVRQAAKLGRGGDTNPPEAYAAREKEIHDGKACFLCAGHTHAPQVAHIYTRNDLKRFFTDTGTWRNAVLSAGDKRSYGRVTAATYVTFFGQGTIPDRDHHGFAFWSGYNQHWPMDDHGL